MPDPSTTYMILLVVQALHLIHHRVAKRHISFVEGTTAVVLCVPITVPVAPWLLAGVHLVLASIQVVGSVWIKHFSPDWQTHTHGV